MAAAIDCSSYSCSGDHKRKSRRCDGTRVLIWNSTYNAQPDAFLAQLLAPTLRLSSKHTSFPWAAHIVPSRNNSTFVFHCTKYTRGKREKGCVGKPHIYFSRRPEGEKMRFLYAFLPSATGAVCDLLGCKWGFSQHLSDWPQSASLFLFACVCTHGECSFFFCVFGRHTQWSASYPFIPRGWK